MISPVLSLRRGEMEQNHETSPPPHSEDCARCQVPSVKRDFALLLDSGVPFSDVERVAKKVERKLLRAVTLFDVYEDPTPPRG